MGCWPLEQLRIICENLGSQITSYITIFCFFYATRTTGCSTGLLNVTNTIIDDVALSGRNPKLHQKLCGHCSVVCSRSYPSQFFEFGWNHCSRDVPTMHQKIWQLQPALENRNELIHFQDNVITHVTQPSLKSWTNWATKLNLIPDTKRTSRLQTTTFSSIASTFWVRNAW